ncbi:MAG: cob(I)yrinic acid a,c-diamide adenosyltransferase [Planctomycetota bacterium]|jgi:cob(I)alamin adenosyltransferase
MKIYTRTGDEGQTGLFRGPRVPKDAPRVEGYGAIDELNAALGLARARPLPDEIDRLVERVQHELFEIGAELSTPTAGRGGEPAFGAERVEAIEADIDRLETELQPLRQFILPGGTEEAAALHFARAVCRRAERRLVTVIRETDGEISPVFLPYLNRLSDLLFVLGRWINARAGRPDVPWRGPGE